jgi:hypothetical protein
MAVDERCFCSQILWIIQPISNQQPVLPMGLRQPLLESRLCLCLAANFSIESLITRLHGEP